MALLIHLPGATGPNTLIGLGKGKADKAALVKKLVPHYKTLLEKLKGLGVSEVQLHEPILVTPGANKYQVSSSCQFPLHSRITHQLRMVHDPHLPFIVDFCTTVIIC